MARYTYEIQAHDNGRFGWCRLFEVGLEYGRGYLASLRDGPTPRLAYRLMRDDGKIMEELPAVEEAGIGLVAGWPSTAQYEAAAIRCLQLAEKASDWRQR